MRAVIVAINESLILAVLDARSVNGLDRICIIG